MRILLAGGGSIGHIAPSVAVAREILAQRPEAKLHFVCSEKHEEAEFLQKEGFSFTALPRPKVGISFPLQYLRARRSARFLFDSFKPDTVFLKGGSLTIPIALLARKRHIPIILHESDVVSGRANRFLSRFADVVCTGFPPQEKHRRFVYTGNPVRPDITRGSAEKGLKVSNLSGTQPILLVWGGSQGAQALNDILRKHLTELLTFCDIIHLTGQGKTLRQAPASASELRTGGQGDIIAAIPGYYERAFAHDDLPHLLAVTDIALSRSGAGSIAELAACGVPTIFVPLRGVAQDHQLKNAEVVEKSGGGIVIDQKRLSEVLAKTVKDVLRDQQKRERMGKNIQKLSIPEAASHIAEIVVEAATRYALLQS